MPIEERRRCSTCAEEKALKDFYLFPRGYREAACRDCAGKLRRARRFLKNGWTPTPPPASCEACGAKGALLEGPKHTRLVVDHDHGANTFRGWICGHCNVALGHAGDNPAILRALADYLDARGRTISRPKIS